MANRTKIGPKARKTFLATLEKTANVSHAAKLCRMSRSRLYEIKHEDDAFSAEWDSAVEVAVDLLEKEARRRGMLGVKKPVYQGGRRVGYIQEYSDVLLIFLLKAHRPSKYRERVDIRHQHSGQVGHTHEMVMGKVLSEPKNIEAVLQAEESIAASLNDASGDSPVGKQRHLADGKSPPRSKPRPGRGDRR